MHWPSNWAMILRVTIRILSFLTQQRLRPRQPLPDIRLERARVPPNHDEVGKSSSGKTTGGGSKGGTENGLGSTLIPSPSNHRIGNAGRVQSGLRGSRDQLRR